MSASTEQSFANHARFVPLYHFVTFGILALFFLLTAWDALSAIFSGHLGIMAILKVVLSLAAVFAVIAVFFFARLFPLGVQDRLIRLEERLRMEKLLPDDLKGRLDELEKGQWIALRFASDGELADRVREALDNKLPSKEIKAKIQNWRADHWRI